MSFSDRTLDQINAEFFAGPSIQQPFEPPPSPKNLTLSPLKQELRIRQASHILNSGVIASWAPGDHRFTVLYPPNLAGEELHL